MDQLTKYLVYNRTPNCRNDMDYDAIKAQKKECEQIDGVVDKRLRLLSPDRESDYEANLEQCYELIGKVLQLRLKDGYPTTILLLGHRPPLREREWALIYHPDQVLYLFSQPNAELLGTESLHPISLDLKSRLVALVIPKWTSSCEDLLLLDTEELMSVSEHYLYFRYHTQDGMRRKGVLGTVQDEYYERVLYARNKLLNGARPAVVGGKPITDELATELRITCFSSASCPPRGEWIRTALMMRPPDQPLGYGLAAPRNGTRSLLSALQAHMIKWLLFDSRPQTKDNKCDVPPDTYLRPSEERQEEALWRACSEVIWRCGGGGNTGQAAVKPKALVALPSEINYVQHSSAYYQDGVTEKFQTEDGIGALLLLYACVLSRGCDNIKKDLDGKLTHLVSAHVEGSINLVTLLLTGRATPYLHNGVLYVGDEDHYAMPQFGILARSHVGLLVWYGGEENSKNNINKQYPGSRLKTPALPIWVTSCSGHYGVLFNTNRELLRNYHAERRFDIHYYTCGGCSVLLNVDTRAHDDVVGTLRSDDINATPLEKLIHTKWQDAKVTWTGSAPYVGEPAK